jgi:ATP-dependent Clp protease adapter protein ClpS
LFERIRHVASVHFQEFSMNGVEAGYVRLVIHDDEDTPQDFVIGLLRSVFSRSVSDAIELMATIEIKGKAVCGTYPRAVAQALLQASQERIRASGHRLVMAAEVGEDVEEDRCKLCGNFAGDKIRLVRTAALICDDCTLAVTDNLSDVTRTKQFNFASAAVEWHFARHSSGSVDRNIATVSWTYAPGRSSCSGQAVFGLAAPFLRHSRAPPLRNAHIRIVEPIWRRCACHCAGAISGS